MTITSFRDISDSPDEEAAALPEAGAADRAAAKGETVEELLLNMHGITVNPAKTMTDDIAAARRVRTLPLPGPLMLLRHLKGLCSML